MNSRPRCDAFSDESSFVPLVQNHHGLYVVYTVHSWDERTCQLRIVYGISNPATMMYPVIIRTTAQNAYCSFAYVGRPSLPLDEVGTNHLGLLVFGAASILGVNCGSLGSHFSFFNTGAWNTYLEQHVLPWRREVAWQRR